MRRAAAIVVLVALALAAAVVALTTARGSSDRRTAEESKRMPILVRCPRAGDRNEHRFASADQVIAVAMRVNHREVTHYQGRAERRTRWNTPVQGLDDSLSPVCCQTFTIFVAKGSRAWIVFGA